MGVKTVHIILTSLVFITFGCSSNELFLVKAPGANPDPSLLRVCLSSAYVEIANGKADITSNEELALGGRDVTSFLWWGSLAGPRPVVNREGQPSRASSLVTYPWIDSQVSKRYVLCLLRNGYEWPTTQIK